MPICLCHAQCLVPAALQMSLWHLLGGDSHLAECCSAATCLLIATCAGLGQTGTSSSTTKELSAVMDGSAILDFKVSRGVSLISV